MNPDAKRALAVWFVAGPVMLMAALLDPEYEQVVAVVGCALLAAVVVSVIDRWFDQ